MDNRLSQRWQRAGRSWRYPAAALSLAVLVGAGAAGCGSMAAPGSGSAGSGSGGSGSAGQGTQVSPAANGSPGPAGTPQPAGLCTRIGTIRALSVVRNRNINRIQVEHFPFPAQVTVTSAASAQAVAKAICALPGAPRGVMNCPLELPGTSYRLTFAAGAPRLPVVTIQATGCQQVSGAGPVRRAISPQFWLILGNAIGLYRAGPPVFGGDGPTLQRCHVLSASHPLSSGCPAGPRTEPPVPVS